MPSESRDYHLFLDDIPEGCDKIVAWTPSLSSEGFFNNDLVFDAVMRNLQVMGEAVKYLPADVRKRHPDVPWRRVAGFRDVVTHFYFGLSNDIVWDIVQNHVPRLRRQIAAIVEAE